jgi:hypothetical protein
MIQILLQVVVYDPNSTLTWRRTFGTGPPTEVDSVQEVMSCDQVVDCTVDFHAGGTSASGCFRLEKIEFRRDRW